MMSFPKPLSRLKKISYFILAAAFLTGCGKEPKNTDYVARVNDSYLTKDELAQIADTSSKDNHYLSEVIRNWVDKELLLQEAEEEGITKTDEYKNLINDSKKELAAALLINRISSSKKAHFNRTDLMKFYHKNSNEFILQSDAYRLNLITFSNQDKAIEFRSLLLNSDWNKAVNSFNGDTSIINLQSDVFLKDENIYLPRVARAVKRLYPPEISIVISDSERYYTVIQLLGKYPEGTLPPFEVIKPKVSVRFMVEKKKEMIEKYLNDLYSTNEIEIKY